jgi:hypothetical protein
MLELERSGEKSGSAIIAESSNDASLRTFSLP